MISALRGLLGFCTGSDLLFWVVVTVLAAPLNASMARRDSRSKVGFVKGSALTGNDASGDTYRQTDTQGPSRYHGISGVRECLAADDMIVTAALASQSSMLNGWRAACSDQRKSEYSIQLVIILSWGGGASGVNSGSVCADQGSPLPDDG